MEGEQRLAGRAASGRASIERRSAAAGAVAPGSPQSRGSCGQAIEHLSSLAGSGRPGRRSARPGGSDVGLRRGSTLAAVSMWANEVEVVACADSTLGAGLQRGRAAAAERVEDHGLRGVCSGDEGVDRPAGKLARYEHMGGSCGPRAAADPSIRARWTGLGSSLGAGGELAVGRGKGGCRFEPQRAGLPSVWSDRQVSADGLAVSSDVERERRHRDDLAGHSRRVRGGREGYGV